MSPARGTYQDEWELLLDQSEGDFEHAVSADNSTVTITAAAPGAGKHLHLRGLTASRSDGGDFVATVTVTIGGVAKTFDVHNSELPLAGLDIRADEDTAVTLDIPAQGAGITARGTLFFYTEG